MSKGTIVSHIANGQYDIQSIVDDAHIYTDVAWCADKTEDLTGNVGVIEIAGDRDKGVNIQPGYLSNAIYNATRDGMLYEVPMSGGSQHAAGNYWNWSLRPGWQKWRPNYRYGTISNIDHNANTADVTLEACPATDTPDGQSLDCNQAASLTGVSFSYMSCNSAAFVNGDEVIVKFTGNSWAAPVVIGFKSEPKPCSWEPWDGPDLCSTEAGRWEINFLYPYDLLTCPSLPISRTGGPDAIELNNRQNVSIADGRLIVQVIHGGLPAFPTYIEIYTTVSAITIEPTEMQLKFDLLSYTPGGNTLGAFMIGEWGDASKTITFYFAGSPTPGPRVIMITDNGGALQTIDISIYGIDMTKLWVDVEAVADDSGEVSFSVDLIHLY